MSNATSSTNFGPSSSWPRPVAGGPVAGVGTALYVLQVPAAVFASRSHKRSTMASTLIDGWPPGPRDGSP